MLSGLIHARGPRRGGLSSHLRPGVRRLVLRDEGDRVVEQLVHVDLHQVDRRRLRQGHQQRLHLLACWPRLFTSCCIRHHLKRQKKA